MLKYGIWLAALMLGHPMATGEQRRLPEQSKANPKVAVRRLAGSHRSKAGFEDAEGRGDARYEDL